MVGTIGGLLIAKLMNVLSGGNHQPLDWFSGVSAVPMAAPCVQKVGQEELPGNFLLMAEMQWAPTWQVLSALQSLQVYFCPCSADTS